MSQDLIKEGGKIVVIGSVAGLLSKLTKKELQDEFTDENLEVEKLLELA